MPLGIRCPRAARKNAATLRRWIPGVVLACMGFAALQIAPVAAQDRPKVSGEDLIARTLELLDAQLRYDQLAAGKRVSVPDLKQSHLKYLEQLVGDNQLVQIRAICAAHRMPWLKSVVQAKQVQLPDTPVYCLKAIEVSARGEVLPDLYMSLALQEQGRSGFQFAEDAKLLANNEAGRTRAAIFKAANAGEQSYVGITGKERPLHCPLAFDAGYAFGYRNADKSQPDELTAAGAEGIARACYDPAVKEITLKGEKLAASRAGLFAGAWLGRQQRTKR